MPAVKTKSTGSKNKRKTTKKIKKNLVIVESPSKAKTIQKYLGSRYKVVASLGHIRDLPKSKMGIDMDNNYDPHYISIRGKGEIIKQLKKEAKNAKNVYLASDPDREGEAIAWHLSYILGLNLKDKNRVVFNEITKETVKQAFKYPRSIDMNLVDAQQARRILDRLVGYSISPLLWSKIKKGLSAGRVQSIALNLIINRENDIKKFIPQEYWTIDAQLQKNKYKFDAEFYGINNKKLKLKTNEDVENILSKLSINDPFIIDNVVRKEHKRQPPLPFTTSTMQQLANSNLKFKTAKTMMIAQQLYEGINIGKHGSVGLITYMRTDSTRISNVARKETLEFISNNYGSEYVSKSINSSKSKESIQDAHEGIRPSSVMRTPDSLKDYLTPDQMKLYSLIWSRFVASQMSPAIYDTVQVNLSQNSVNYHSSGSQIIFDGYTKIYKYNLHKDNKLPSLTVGEKIKIISNQPNQHFTLPPARYTEASLIKALESNGVGRPSTYAPTLLTIQKRYYVKLLARKFEPTELGMIVNQVISDYFPDILNIDFTADLEGQLDEIEEGKRKWIRVVDDFYKPFKHELDSAIDKIEKIKIKDEPAGFDCDVCGAPMVIKMGRFGKFYACSRFPECRNTKAMTKDIGVICPKCGEGKVLERKSKKNRIFYGCSRYPNCDFVSWDMPIGRNCPKDGHYLVYKKVRGGRKIVCPNGDYEEPIDNK